MIRQTVLWDLDLEQTQHRAALSNLLRIQGNWPLVQCHSQTLRNAVHGEVLLFQANHRFQDPGTRIVAILNSGNELVDVVSLEFYSRFCTATLVDQDKDDLMEFVVDCRPDIGPVGSEILRGTVVYRITKQGFELSKSGNGEVLVKTYDVTKHGRSTDQPK